MGYKECYESARNRYNNAIYEQNVCYYKGLGLNQVKQLKIAEINSLNTQLNEHRNALTQVITILGKEWSVDQDVATIKTNTNTASENYTQMINHTDITNKDFTDVFEGEMTLTMNAVDSIFLSLGVAKSSLTSEVEDYELRLLNAQNELADIEADIRANNDLYNYYGGVKSSASYDMEYYRRKMQEEADAAAAAGTGG